MSPPDIYDLERFVSAQEHLYDRVLDELRQERKQSHWMWFVFPQLSGLGLSAMSRRYAIASLDEAQAYMRHPILGRRLIECAGIIAESEAPSVDYIFGTVDAHKLHSSMTLFHHAAPDEPVFERVLNKFFAGVPDNATEQRL
jgi:uncharacterized protein (DUF1810 family)